MLGKLQRLRHFSKPSHKELLPFLQSPSPTVSALTPPPKKKKNTASTELGITKSTVTGVSVKGSMGTGKRSTKLSCHLQRTKETLSSPWRQTSMHTDALSSNLHFSTGFWSLRCVGTKPFLDSSLALTIMHTPVTYGFRTWLRLGRHYDVIAVGSLCFTDFRSFFIGFLVC